MLRNETKPRDPIIRKTFDLIDDSDLADHEIAKKAGIARQTLSMWRNGHKSPSLFLVQCVLRTLGYKLEIVKCKQQ